ncbi:MAG: SCO family protein [Caulobacteraceae bacterium]|nr:SCO family protein [Caulobacteraceae bacterium]
MTRKTLILAIALAVLIVGGAVAAWQLSPKPGAPQGQALVGGDFQLVNQDGKPVDQSVLNGKWSVVFFGFTYCPDICPTTLQSLEMAVDRLGPKAKDLQVVFISVDPERDTPQLLKTYLANDAFPKGVIGLTGTPEQVAAAARAYRVFYEKSGEGPGYTVNHSTASYLMDRKGRFNRVLAYGLGPDETAHQISEAMRGG